MTTVKTYISDLFTTFVAAKRDNSHLSEDILFNYFHSEGDLETVTQKFLDETQLDIEETTFKQYTIADVKAKSTKDLLAFHAKTPNWAGLEMAETVLLSRNATFTPRLAEVMNDFMDSIPEPEVETEETTPVEKNSPKKKTTPRKLLKEYTEEELDKILTECRTRKGLICTFTCKKYGDTLLSGTIKSARLDKRSGFIQYRIETEVNGMKEILGCAHNSKTLTITSAYHTYGLTNEESAAVEEASTETLEKATVTE